MFIYPPGLKLSLKKLLFFLNSFTNAKRKETNNEFSTIISSILASEWVKMNKILFKKLSKILDLKLKYPICSPDYIKT